MAYKSITEISLADVRKLVDNKNFGADIAEAVGNLLGVVLALSPVVAGPIALPLWGLIEPKNELIEAWKNAARRISSSKPSDYLDQAERLAAANCLLVYVAFFDAVRQQWPRVVREMGLDEKAVERALQETVGRIVLLGSGNSVAVRAVAIPHPVDRPSDAACRKDIFERLAGCVAEALPLAGKLVGRDPRGVVNKRMLELTSRAEALYQAEYLGLAVESQRFFVWSVLQGQGAGDAQLRRLAEDERTWFELISRGMHSLDLGMQGLAEAIARLPYALVEPATWRTQPNVRLVAEELHRSYGDVLLRQVIDSQSAVDESGVQLSFPRKIDGFIPQAYRVATYDGKETRMEDEDAWRRREVQEDIGAFVLRYLESPYSVQTPLLILGHPGSGKSLLTEVLAGHLAYPAYTTVRVPLRDVDPDVHLLTQLKAQIFQDTGGRTVEWADFTEGLGMCPPVVILDGYDELLQATGKVYASYLDEVRLFQHQQAVQQRPVRVIVTSRLTLIDKAAVPLGTTVVKLEEFDRQRRDAWCEVWNTGNRAFFRENRLRPFAVPGNPKLLELARQPLLLLMLAIYDSLGNELSSQPDIDQTLLYDRLLRRFIERELSKGGEGREFAARPQAERTAAINWEMDRLGVAAVGMFSRQDVKISREDLNADLRYFDRERGTAADGRVLADADMLLGSFFFVHESRSKLQQNAASSDTGSVAFEFLHNTFGEFLVADFILRRAVTEARMISKMAIDPMLAEAHGQRLRMLSEDWFGALLHTPLYTRPVILSMLREWSRNRMGDERWPRAAAMAAFDAIIAAQLHAIVNDMSIPDPDPRRRGLSPYPVLPRRGNLAIYSLNLVLLRTYMGDGEYVLDEKDLGEWGGATRPWDSLISLWRSWFPSDSLRALVQAFTAKRRHERIVVVPSQSELIQGMGSPLNDLYSSSVALADRVTATATGLLIAPFARMPEMIFAVFWEEFGDAVPELAPIANVLRLKMYAANGDDLRAARNPDPDAKLRLSLDLAEEGNEVASDFGEMVAGMVHTPLQWRRVSIPHDELPGLRQLSRSEAESAVSTRVRLDPGWLLNLLTSDRGTGGAWRDFVQSPAAAPVLRAAVREFDRGQARDSIAGMRSSLREKTIEVVDIDTASALLVLSYLGGATSLCAHLLDTITEKCDQGTWSILDVPVQTWEGLADVFHSAIPAINARKDRFLGPLEAAVTNSVAVAGNDSYYDTDKLPVFWVHAMRIGAVRNQERILQKLENRLSSIPVESVGLGNGWLLSMVGWAREVGNPSAIQRFMQSPAGRAWFGRFGLAEGAWNPGVMDSSDVARLLSHRQAMDLRWALELLQREEQKKENPPRGKKLQP